MKVTNKHVYNTDQDYLVTLREEYTQLGFDTDLSTGHLTVFTVRRKKAKAKDDKASGRRNNR